jgi:hypothetical protein
MRPFGVHLANLVNRPSTEDAGEVVMPDFQLALDLTRKSKISIPFHRELIRIASPIYCKDEHFKDQSYVAASNLKILQIIYTVAKNFKLHGIEHIFYKGPLQQKVLHGDFFFKPCSDADVIVPRDQFLRARKVLESLSFEIPAECQNIWWTHFLGEQPLFPEGRRPHSIDLHHRMQQPGSPAPRHLDRFFSQPNYVTVGSLQVPIPRLLFLALIAAMNLVKAVYNRQPAGNHALDLLVSVRAMTAQQRAQLQEEATLQGLRNTLEVATELSAASFQTDNLLGAKGLSMRLSGEQMESIIFRASDSEAVTPRRSRMLFELCDNLFFDLPNETARWALSEGTRVLFQPK